MQPAKYDVAYLRHAVGRENMFFTNISSLTGRLPKIFVSFCLRTFATLATDANRRCEREQRTNLFGLCRAARRKPIGNLSAIELAQIAEARRRKTKSMTRCDNLKCTQHGSHYEDISIKIVLLQKKVSYHISFSSANK